MVCVWAEVCVWVSTNGPGMEKMSCAALRWLCGTFCQTPPTACQPATPSSFPSKK